MSRGPILVAIICLLALAPAGASWAIEYRVVDMSPILGQYGAAKDMNNRGAVIGDMRVGQETHAFYWTESEGLVDLGTYPGTTRGYARGVDEFGRTVGFGSPPTAGVSYRALWWDAEGNVTDLGVLPGAYSSAAYDINDNGQVLGISTFETPAPPGGLPDYEKHAVIWNIDNDTVEDLGALFVGLPWSAYQINNDGDILGYNLGDDGYEHWVRHRDGTLTVLDDDGGEHIPLSVMNDRGLVAGSLADSEQRMLATIWNPDGSVRSRLEPLPGDVFSWAYGLDNLGVVVGESSTADTIRAVVWEADGTAVSLGSLPGFEISRAYMVNDAGWILGECGTSGDWRTVLWIPVPEPASLSGLAAGIGTMIFLRRAKRPRARQHGGKR